MGLRFRKSFNLGGFRINLSKSGIGYSFGAKGVRFTKKAGGGTRTTLHIPHTGLSYVKDSKKPARSGGSHAAPALQDRVQETEFYEEEIVESTPNEMIEKLNRADKLSPIFKVCRIIFPILAFAFLVTTFSIIANGNAVKLVSEGVEKQVDGTAFAIILGILGALSLGATLFFALQKIEVELQYDLADEAYEKKYKSLSAGLSALRKNEKLWEVLADGNSVETITRVEREEIKFVPLESYIKTNLSIFEMQIYHKKLLFLPDLLAVKQQSGWVGIKYSEISATMQEVPLEELAVPEDAEVISQRWFYANKDGSRDRRRQGNNYEVYQCRYGGIYISSENALGINILCSSLKKAKEFYDAFYGYIQF